MQSVYSPNFFRKKKQKPGSVKFSINQFKQIDRKDQTSIK